MNIPKDLFYTKDHEWARLEGKKAYVGITDYAQGALGDITFAGLPKNGDAVKQSDLCATVESVKAASDVYAPLSGRVVSLNEKLAAHPELVNKSPYEEGYFFVMDVSDESEKTKLMDAASYGKYLEGIAK
ncbi:MAG: glycine cleavage system protein GcvH [Candidatus Omnitrophica bacterium]|nr:glycine cleavage system protein GcvH [Candidatus Omnitrophota bacterium]MDD5436571.1 glycine cleavage system protein GcvH [Candidatus Omnitrophota bacterium]